jgi:hypothetical protein
MFRRLVILDTRQMTLTPDLVALAHRVLVSPGPEPND